PNLPSAGTGTDCLVVIYTTERALLGKRFVLDSNILRIGRGPDNTIVLEGDSVSRRHSHLEKRPDGSWYAVDDRSTNGTYVNEDQVPGELKLQNGDRIKVGPTILKFLSGADAEAKYHEEIYRMTIIDGLTQIHNKRYLLEAIDRDVLRARRHERALAVLMFDIDHFKRINDTYGHLAGDHVLRELARVISERTRRDEVFARYGGEEFAILLPETSLEGAHQLGETLRRKVEGHRFVFQRELIPVTISMGAACLGANMTATELITAADAKLYEAKRSGRNCIKS
ncbi:MAG: GGDEF domain-containing protein, partial [Polyangiaceae bacterium]|nr:GGDEF domain-containing protein [Polyangiaceae bacterium]